jgi:hypothetical protein
MGQKGNVVLEAQEADGIFFGQDVDFLLGESFFQKTPGKDPEHLPCVLDLDKAPARNSFQRRRVG